jgi:hypothetical protein
VRENHLSHRAFHPADSGARLRASFTNDPARLIAKLSGFEMDAIDFKLWTGTDFGVAR